MRVSIRCEECGHRHRLERDITDGKPIWLVCHWCETPLRAETQSVIAPGRPTPLDLVPSGGPQHASIWGGLFDLREAGPHPT